MLEIVSPEGISLDLPDDIAIAMEFNNPLFAEDSIVGDYSLNFKLQWTDTNVKAFKHVHVIENRTLLNTEYTGYTIRYGNSFYKGSLVVTEVPWKFFEVRFKSNHGNFKKMAEDVNLNEIDLPETVISFKEAGNFWGLKSAKDINSDLLSLFSSNVDINGISINPVLFIPIFNEHAFDDNGTAYYSKHLNYYYNPDNVPNFGNEYLFILGYNQSGIDAEFPITPFKWTNMTPCLNFYYLIYKIIARLGYNFKGDIFSKRDLLDLYTIGNNAYFFYYTDFYDIQGETREFRDIKGSLSMPQSATIDFIKDFVKLFCVYFGINENTKTLEFIAKEDILKNRSYIDVTDITSPEINRLQEPRRGYTLSYEFDQNDIALTEETIEPTKADKYIGEYDTVIALPVATSVPINSIAYVKDDDYFYRTYRNNGNAILWEKKYQNFSSFKYGHGSNKIEIKNVNPTLIYRDPDIFQTTVAERNWKLPKFGNRMKMESAYSMYFEGEDVSLEVPTLKMFFYRGLQRDSRPNSFYPLGTPDEYNYNNDVVGESSLKFHGERGIANVWHKEYLEYMAKAKPVELYQKYSIDLLFNTPKLWKNMIRVKDVNFRIKNIQVTLYKHKIGIAKTLAYTAY